MEYLGLHNKTKAAVHPEHKLTGPKKKKKKRKRKKKKKRKKRKIKKKRKKKRKKRNKKKRKKKRKRKKEKEKEEKKKKEEEEKERKKKKNTIFSNTLSFLSSLNVSDQVSHPYKPTSKIIVLYILIFKFLDSNLKDKIFCTE